MRIVTFSVVLTLAVDVTQWKRSIAQRRLAARVAAPGLLVFRSESLTQCKLMHSQLLHRQSRTVCRNIAGLARFVALILLLFAFKEHSLHCAAQHCLALGTSMLPYNRLAVGVDEELGLALILPTHALCSPSACNSLGWSFGGLEVHQTLCDGGLGAAAARPMPSRRSYSGLACITPRPSLLFKLANTGLHPAAEGCAPAAHSTLHSGLQIYSMLGAITNSSQRRCRFHSSTTFAESSTCFGGSTLPPSTSSGRACLAPAYTAASMSSSRGKVAPADHVQQSLRPGATASVQVSVLLQIGQEARRRSGLQGPVHAALCSQNCDAALQFYCT